MKGKLLGFTVALLAVATVGVVQLQTKAAVQYGRECDQYAVIRCGVMSAQEARNKYDQASVIFRAMGIQKSEISGDVKQGVVYEDGRVVVGGKTVATGARTAIRNMGGGQHIAGTNAAIYPTSASAHAHSALVFYKGGRFAFAISKPCGNPVTATPTAPPPKPEATCKALTINKLDRTRIRFNAAAEVKHGAKVKSYTYVVTRAGKTVLNKTTSDAHYVYKASQPGSYHVRLTVNTSVGKKTNSNCVKAFTIKAAPVAECKSLTIDKISRTQFRFNGKASADGGAKIKAYVFKVYRGSTLVATKTVTSSKAAASYVYNQTQTGAYTVRLTVKTSEGDKTGAHCVKPFTVVPAENPGINVTKYVEHQKYKRVGVNVQFEYEIAVKNTGSKNLTNVVVTDTPQSGITLLSASAGSISGNKWTYTIPSLSVGQTVNFTLKAKVPVYLAGMLENTVCVNAPEIPGNPDDCDTANVDVPPTEQVEVCNPETGEIITVDKDQADQYVPIKSDQCKEMKVCVLATNSVEIIKKTDFDSSLHTTDLSRCKEVTVTELPTTGPADVAMQLLGVASLTGAGAYYVSSRRQRA